jgi:hypothetical protein
MINKRDSNIELLRIVLMIIIVMLHIFTHGIDVVNNPDSSKNHLLLYSIMFFPVDCFIFISGYYGIHLKLKTILKFYFQLVFYALSTLFMVTLFFNNPFQIKELIKSFFPISFVQWDFFSRYLWLMLFSPFLNKGITLISPKAFRIILILFGLFIFFAYLFNSASNERFVFIYLTGRYLKGYPLRIFNKKACLLFASCALLSIIIMFVRIDYIPQIPFRYIYDYSNPITILMAISFFFLFKNRSAFHNNMINYLSSGVFAVFLITDSNVLRKIFNNFAFSITGENWFYIFLFAIITVFLFSLLDVIIRKPIYCIIENQLNKRFLKWDNI